MNFATGEYFGASPANLRVSRNSEAYAPRLGMLLVQADNRGVYQFCDDSSVVRYSLWLAAQAGV
jgi:hypothetical protein